MSKGKISALLLTALVLNLGANACGTGPSQGPTDQRPAQQDATEKNEQPSEKEKDQ